MTLPAEGQIVWTDDDLVHFVCVCGEELTLTSDEERRCSGCGKRLLASVIASVWEPGAEASPD